MSTTTPAKKPMGLTVKHKRQPMHPISDKNPLLQQPIYEEVEVTPAPSNGAPFFGLPLQLPNMLGIPLRYRHEYNMFQFMSFAEGFAGPEKQRITGDEGTNFTLYLLAMNVDPTSEWFGKAMLLTKQMHGEALLSRLDGKDLSVKDVESIVAFINTELAEVVAYRDLRWRPVNDNVEDETEEEVSSRLKAAFEQAKIAIDKKITPSHFNAFIANYRAEMALTDPSWANIESPSVEGGGPFCQTCGRNAHGAGKPLLVCGKCKKASYCGVACQRSDWRMHKDWQCGEEVTRKVTTVVDMETGEVRVVDKRRR